jgi:hypothetical protein
MCVSLGLPRPPRRHKHSIFIGLFFSRQFHRFRRNVGIGLRELKRVRSKFDEQPALPKVGKGDGREASGDVPTISVRASGENGGHGARGAFAHPTGYSSRRPRGVHSALLTSLMRGPAASIMLR